MKVGCYAPPGYLIESFSGQNCLRDFQVIYFVQSLFLPATSTANLRFVNL